MAPILVTGTHLGIFSCKKKKMPKKREFKIVMSGQFHTLAMFWIHAKVVQCQQLFRFLFEKGK